MISEDTDMNPSTLTFLVSKVEVALGQAGERALILHDRRVARAVELAGGVILQDRGGLGNNYCLFNFPLDAIAVAHKLYKLTDALPMRMGLDTGSTFSMQDCYAKVVNKAARLGAAAHSGQILVSSTTAGLAAHALPQGCSLIDLGERRLHTLSDPERVFELAERNPAGNLQVLPLRVPSEAMATCFVAVI
jgi:class 3 adenylate cyclase